MSYDIKNVFKVYKKVEKANDFEKSSYEIVKLVLNELSRSMQLLIYEIDKKKSFIVSRQRHLIIDTQKTIQRHVAKCITSIYSLQVSLDFEKGGEISTNLFQLYEFCRKQIIKAFVESNNLGLKKSLDALNQIISAWETIKD